MDRARAHIGLFGFFVPFDEYHLITAPDAPPRPRKVTVCFAGKLVEPADQLGNVAAAADGRLWRPDIGPLHTPMLCTGTTRLLSGAQACPAAFIRHMSSL